MKRLVAPFILFGLLSAGRVHASDNPKAWSEEIAPFHIAGPIYYVGTHGLGVYLIETKAGLILLSGALPQSDPLLIQSIRKLGFKVEDIHQLLITHAHVDHVGTLAAFKKLTHAPVAVMAADVELLKSGGKEDYLFAKRPDMHFDGVIADKILKDGDKIALGGIEMTAHLTPGHTPGCTTWEMTIHEDGKAYDVVFADGTGINPGTQFVKKPSYPGIAADYRRTFQVLASLHPDIFLSYHAEFFDLDAKRKRMDKEGIKAWIDPEAYKSIVRKKRNTFEQLVQAETAAAKTK